MRKNFTKKATSMLLATSMIVGSTSFLAGCGSKKSEIVTLDVYSQLANYSGVRDRLDRRYLKGQVQS